MTEWRTDEPQHDLEQNEEGLKLMTTLQCFTPEEKERAHRLLAIRVAHMMGRKFEEGDWSYVYCKAKGFRQVGWSNLEIDVTHENLGIEHKMLCYRSKPSVEEACGTTLMHPSATRSIRLPSLDSDPDDAMVNILTQYGELIRKRTKKVRSQNRTGKPEDMRTGWLLWQAILRQFLYFEEPMSIPDPDLFEANWVEREPGKESGRKGSKNLWIFEKATGRKRYSITTSAGAKIQPYFDVPPPTDPNLHVFTVIGEQFMAGKVRMWLTEATLRDLQRLFGTVDAEALSQKIAKAANIATATAAANIPAMQYEPGGEVVISVEAYKALVDAFPGVTDEHSVRLLIESTMK